MPGSGFTEKYPEKIICIALLLSALSISIHTLATAAYDISAHARILPLTDTEDGGTSVIEFFLSDPDSVKVEFVYGDGYIYPYAGLEFLLTEPVRIQDYQNLRLSVGNMKLKTISIGLFATDKRGAGVTTWFETEMPIRRKEKNDESLPLDEFYTPTWWFYNNGTPLAQTDLDDYSRITRFQIRCRKRTDTDTGDTLLIKAIELRRSRASLIAELISAAAVAFMGIAVLFTRDVYRAVRSRLKAYQPILYKKQNIRTDREKWDTCVDLQIRNGLEAPEFDLNRAGTICGISNNELCRLVKKYTGLTFPAYVRKLRVARAQDMLRTTNKSVTTVSEDSGFKSVSGFNSAFKRETGRSPSEYRKQNENE